MATEDPHSNRLPGQFWSSVKVAGGAKDLATYVLQSWGAYRLANAISADSAKDSELGRTFSPYASGLGISAEACH